MRASVSINVEIRDADTLYQKASQDYRDQNNGRDSEQIEAELVDFLGEPESPKIDRCLIQLFDRPMSPAVGLEVQDSHAAVGDAGFRTSSVLHISSRHLTAEERYRIRKSMLVTAFDGNDTQVVALAHAEHDGLYLKPKGTGFLLRVPYEAEADSYALSPEMRAIISHAKAVGAWMIDVDEDETPNPALPTFNDQELIIRDLDSDQDDPLYWSNEAGWGSRQNATVFSLEETATINLPAVGARPAWIDFHDPADAPYQFKG